jgi:hypothetical protein
MPLLLRKGVCFLNGCSKGQREESNLMNDAKPIISSALEVSTVTRKRLCTYRRWQEIAPEVSLMNMRENLEPAFMELCDVRI